MNHDHIDQAATSIQHFAEFPADAQVDTSTISTQALRPLHPQASEASEQHNIKDEKFESVQSKGPPVESQNESVPASKYNKLKRQFSQLREVSSLFAVTNHFAGVPPDDQRMGELYKATRNLEP